MCTYSICILTFNHNELTKIRTCYSYISFVVNFQKGNTLFTLHQLLAFREMLQEVQKVSYTLF